MRISLVLCAALLALACTPASRPSLDEITMRNAAAMGGRDKLDRLHSVQVVRNANMISVTRRPYFHRVELFHDDGRLRYAEGVDGRVAWEQTERDSARRPVTGRAATALWRVLQWPGPLNPLYRMADRGHTLELLEDTTLADTHYHRILLTLSDGFQRTYFLNANTYLIERARDYRRLHAPDQTAQNIESIWGDFRGVDGYVFPFYSEERNFETGERFYGSTMIDIQVNVELDDVQFGLEGTSRPDVLRSIVRGALP